MFKQRQIKIIYIYASDCIFAEINLITTKWNIYHIHKQPLSDIKDNQYPKLLCIDDEIHLIGGSHNKSHLIWNPAITDFQQIASLNDNEADFRILAGVHVISQNAIFSISSRDGIYKYDSSLDETKREWHKVIEMTDTGVKYAQLNRSGYVLTPNEDFVIMIGRKVNEFKIYSLDLKEHDLYTLDVKAPITDDREYSGLYYAVLQYKEENQLLVDGYMRYMTNEMELIVPLELNMIIHMYCKIEIVHIVADNLRYHWKCDLNEILNATKTKILW